MELKKTNTNDEIFFIKRHSNEDAKNASGALMSDAIMTVTWV